MGKYIIGFDGGGTKTQCALFTVQGEKVDILNWGTTNHECLPSGMSELSTELRTLTNTVLQRNDIYASDIEYGVFGMAGVDTKVQHCQVSKILLDLGFKDFLLCNDAYLGIKGGVRNGHGICVINGTGCTVTGLNIKGDMLQIGGQGTLTGDRGGAGSIGGMAVGAAYNQLFKFGASTIITELLFAQLKISDKYMFLEVLTDKIASGELSLAELNRVVFDSARLGDNKASEMLREVGEDIGNSINGIIAELFKEETHIEAVLAGSLNVKEKSSILQEAMISKVGTQNPSLQMKYSILQHPPVAGAVIWALTQKNPQIDAFQRVRSQF